MKALIFAAGLGTRLKPLTDSMPKAMVPVAGKPLIWHIIQKLKASGYDDIVINVYHFADIIKDYVRDNDNFGVNIEFSDERGVLEESAPLETGGGILYAEPLLLSQPINSAKHKDIFSDEAKNMKISTGRFLVHNVDILSDLDLSWFSKQSDIEDVATILVSSRETKRYFLFNDDMRLVGWTNVATGEVRTPFENLDIHNCHKLAFSGIHLISNRLFDIIHNINNGPNPLGKRFSIVDLYLRIAAEYPIHGVVNPEVHMVDVGKMETLSIAEDFLNQLNSKS